MTEEEKIIYNLKRRKLRISAYIFMILLFFILLAFTLSFNKKNESHVSEENIRATITDKPIEVQIPQLLHYFHTVESFNAKLIFNIYFSALGIGIFLGLLIIELFIGGPKDRLLISLWERISELEKKSKEI